MLDIWPGSLPCRPLHATVADLIKAVSKQKTLRETSIEFTKVSPRSVALMSQMKCRHMLSNKKSDTGIYYGGKTYSQEL